MQAWEDVLPLGRAIGLLRLAIPRLSCDSVQGFWAIQPLRRRRLPELRGRESGSPELERPSTGRVSGGARH